MNTSQPESIAIIIPAFNEAVTIATVVRNATSMGHVIVVNDGSSDATEREAKIAGATVLTLPVNQGYENALTLGMQFAVESNFAFALTMDADGQHCHKSAKQLIATIHRCDIAIGIRRKKQRVAEYIGGWIGSRLWGINDPFSGLKLYRLDTCKKLGNFDTRKLVGAEMFVRAHRSGLTLLGIPIDTVERADVPRFGGSLRANLKIARATVLLIGISLGLIQ